VSFGGESPEVPPRPAGAVPGTVELRAEPAAKPGERTSEFLLSVVGLVVAAILAWRGAYKEAAELAGWCVAGYGVSRGLAKLRAT
jgi:hypothetical protein